MSNDPYERIRQAKVEAAEKVAIEDLAAKDPNLGYFQQPKITGYRQLSEEKVALMNEAKALAEQCGAFIETLRTHRDVTRLDINKAEPALDQRWISIGATQLQQGFMAVIRGIAQPTTF